MPSLKKLRDRSTWETRIVGGRFGMFIMKLRYCPVCWKEELAQAGDEIPEEEFEEYKKTL